MLSIWIRAKISIIVLIAIFNLFKKEAILKLGNLDLNRVYYK